MSILRLFSNSGSSRSSQGIVALMVNSDCLKNSVPAGAISISLHSLIRTLMRQSAMDEDPGGMEPGRYARPSSSSTGTNQSESEDANVTGILRAGEGIPPV